MCVEITDAPKLYWKYVETWVFVAFSGQWPLGKNIRGWCNWNWSYSPETFNSGQNQRFFVLCDLEIWWMTLENNRAPLLYYTKHCASFQIHRWIQIGVTVRKRSIWVKIGNFLSRVTLKFDGWPWKTIGHLFYVASSFMHHFTAISKIQSGVTVRKRPILVKIDDFF